MVRQQVEAQQPQSLRRLLLDVQQVEELGLQQRVHLAHQVVDHQPPQQLQQVDLPLDVA